MLDENTLCPVYVPWRIAAWYLMLLTLQCTAVGIEQDLRRGKINVLILMED